LGQHNIITCLKKGYSEREICQTIITRREGLGTSEIINSIVGGEDVCSEYRSVPQERLYEGEELFIRLTGISGSTADYSVHSILNKIESNSVFLGKKFNIFQGLVTGAHKVSNSHIKKYNLNNVDEGDGIYVLSLNEIANKGFYSNEIELLKPWFKNSDILRWHTKKDSKEKVIYLSTKKFCSDIPNVKQHLDKFKLILINRNIRAGQVSLEDYELFIKRKANLSYVMNAAAMKLGNYYCLSYPRDENDFLSPKIVAPQRSRTNTFGYNEIPWFASTDVYFITPSKESKDISLKYVLAILNSRLYYFWFNQRIQRKGEMLELFKTPLSKTPIRLPSPDIQELLIRLVDSILNLSPSEKDRIRNYEVQIDKIIYELYGLTTDEIAVVEGSS
jgi:adenine-specific DNA-methyltransferase